MPNPACICIQMVCCSGVVGLGAGSFYLAVA